MARLTQDDIDQMIEKTETIKMGKKTTVVLATLTNGFELVGTSSCVDPADYDSEIGERLALERVKKTIWQLEGYREQVRRHLAETDPAISPAHESKNPKL